MVLPHILSFQCCVWRYLHLCGMVKETRDRRKCFYKRAYKHEWIWFRSLKNASIILYLCLYGMYVWVGLPLGTLSTCHFPPKTLISLAVFDCISHYLLDTLWANSKALLITLWHVYYTRNGDKFRFLSARS